MAARFTELIVDAADPSALARWWADVLGWRVTDEDDEGTEIADPAGVLPTIVFVPVPEAKAGKNRLHIDVSPVGCDQDEELQRLLSLGDQHRRRPGGRRDVGGAGRPRGQRVLPAPAPCGSGPSARVRGLRSSW